MVYESNINITIDTICPWTYLARRRVQRALDQVRAAHPDCPTTFKIKYSPFQLYPHANKEGEDRYAWYKKLRYSDSEEKMEAYTVLMSAYGADYGINFKFGGPVANTLDAHRVIQHFQAQKGAEVADKLVESLFSQYHEHERHPSSRETLLAATAAAGIPEAEAAVVIDDPRAGLQDLEARLQEQRVNGVDTVPFIVVEGRRRDLQLEGAREVDEYVKLLEQTVRESS
ncbi:uncharacterized protein K452DRAFT_288777 [Aplosporella prunicola CBS 121167]|uniref:DSBA-like thioredoxin domain-containing protein n=1 Tax=Aplosporella prunicola CBS 121167 TaxID=1176127 RepID=A0A6A6BBQ5_9PEZI|nr:uncharacterized protein K452DRAFT_288777 [Aplosporella prunicola CBS 121167]KAF2140684.1 hypothetical protein K452DRAFT_288777 [Aplosporella prunicola CBS 121167]